MKSTKNSNSFKRSVLICQQCGKYSINNLENLQICSCKTILKIGVEKLDYIDEIVDCKICSLIANKN
ncbi:MAG: hypothetical protein HeimC3_36590 [Candidatus Heimdallarchaeota archaeon LC_3]|nr:MAG: hypothetical protein HeimC3_36590 [Candidatus Heimdallarchaeota archaeon LC_3]